MEGLESALKNHKVSSEEKNMFYGFIFVDEIICAELSDLMILNRFHFSSLSLQPILF